MTLLHQDSFGMILEVYRNYGNARGTFRQIPITDLLWIIGMREP